MEFPYDFESFDEDIFESKFVCQKLNLFKNDSYSCQVPQEFEIDFEQKSTVVVNQILKHQDNSTTATKKIVKSKKNLKQSKKDRNQKDYKKNICRNILRHAVKSMYSNEECSNFINELVDDPSTFKCFYNRALEQITGFRVLRDHLLHQNNDSQFEKNRKLAFKHYLVWYLKNKATGMILRGETQYPGEYLRYKNEVLLYYIHKPHEWMSNCPEWQHETQLQFQSTTIEHNI